MFGYVTANFEKLTLEEKQHYQAYYCGLCRALGNRCGALSRMTLTYDMAFLVLFLTAIYKPNTAMEDGRCLAHPFKPRRHWRNEITDYAADMNLLLAYYNLLDDWADERKVLSLGIAKLFQRQYNQIVARYPKQYAVINDCLNELSGIEKSGELNPDIPAECFGNLMGEIFVRQEDEYAENLRSFGKALGKFIYIMDACLDLKADIKKERYNPLIAVPSGNFRDILNLLMGGCVEKYKLLPIHEDKNLIDNILYSGVWTRYEAAKQQPKETLTQ